MAHAKQLQNDGYETNELGLGHCHFLARDVIYTSRAYATMSVSVCLSTCLSVTEVHWRIIANLGFKFRSQFTEGIIAGKSGGIISCYASHC